MVFTIVHDESVKHECNAPGFVRYQQRDELSVIELMVNPSTRNRQKNCYDF
jgi:hypothetical protein